MKHWLIFLVVLTAWSCAPDTNNEKSTTYYDINGLVDRQIKLLVSASPSILKKAIIDGHEEESKIQPQDSAHWAKELIIFKSADINRSMLSDSYIISESSNSRIKTITYTSKYPDDTEVDALSVELDNDQKPMKIRAILDNQNELFKSAKTLEVKFKDVNGQKLISSYSIEGWQKMISKDSAAYLIEADLVYP